MYILGWVCWRNGILFQQSGQNLDVIRLLALVQDGIFAVVFFLWLFQHSLSTHGKFTLLSSCLFHMFHMFCEQNDSFLLLVLRRLLSIRFSTFVGGLCNDHEFFSLHFPFIHLQMCVIYDVWSWIKHVLRVQLKRKTFSVEQWCQPTQQNWARKKNFFDYWSILFSHSIVHLYFCSIEYS